MFNDIQCEMIKILIFRYIHNEFHNLKETKVSINAVSVRMKLKNNLHFLIYL